MPVLFATLVACKVPLLGACVKADPPDARCSPSLRRKRTFIQAMVCGRYLVCRRHRDELSSGGCPSTGRTPCRAAMHYIMAGNDSFQTCLSARPGERRQIRIRPMNQQDMSDTALPLGLNGPAVIRPFIIRRIRPSRTPGSRRQRYGGAVSLIFGNLGTTNSIVLFFASADRQKIGSLIGSASSTTKTCCHHRCRCRGLLPPYEYRRGTHA